MTEDRHSLRHEIYMARCSNTPRFVRAYQLANQILSLMSDFVPSERECRRVMYDHLIEAAYRANVAVISVRPEWDEMDRLKLEQAVHEAKMAPAMVPCPIFGSPVPPKKIG